MSPISYLGWRKQISSNRSRGFTLVELLVVIAIIGVLVGMTLPAVQMVREAARRTECTNNMRQLGLAITQYHDTQSLLPPARGRDGYLTWPVYLMPFVEQQNLYDQFDLMARYEDQDPDVVRQTMPTMFCPSRRLPEVSNREVNGEHVGACGDYVGNAGTSEYFPYDDWANFDVPVDGVFNSGLNKENPIVNGRLEKGARGRYKLRDIEDGLSHTIFLGEKAVNLNAIREPGGWGDGCVYNGNEPGTIMRIGGYGMGIAGTQYFGAPGPGTIPVFGSAHPDACNFVMGDSSVHTVNVSMDEETLRRLCSRLDGQTVSID